jgi:tetratricopeptide (TPR) repeat protein
VWPHPLVFDYGTPLVGSLAEVWWQAVVLITHHLSAHWTTIRKPRGGFLLAWFFLILAPSSSIVPVATQTMAEHRMYLPLAAVIAFLAFGAHKFAGWRATIGLLVLALGAGILTARRNLVYRSELALWSDTVAQRPDNARAHTNLGIAFTAAGRAEEAIASFREALRLDPSSAATHRNLCELLTSLGRAGEALPHGEEAVRLEPRNAGARASLAGVLETLGNAAAAQRDFAAAITLYRRALEFSPDSIPVRANLANSLLVTGQVDGAIAHYQEVLRRNPGDRRAEENLAIALEIQRTRSR